MRHWFSVLADYENLKRLRWCVDIPINPLLSIDMDANWRMPLAMSGGRAAHHVWLNASCFFDAEGGIIIRKVQELAFRGWGSLAQ